MARLIKTEKEVEGRYSEQWVVVEDEGEGIAPEMRRRVFTKFWTSGVRGGSGLGLYLVNGLVRAHGGTVVIGEAEAGGARIGLTWPADDHRTSQSRA